MSNAISRSGGAAAVEAALAEADHAGSAGRPGRPSWSGLLRLSLVAIPVKAYPACHGSTSIQFNQLHANCGQRIRHQKHCPVHGPVAATAIVRGYQYARDQYIVVESEELEQLRPAKDKALVLEQFIPAHHIDPILFAGRSLFLRPDGLAARHPYAVITDALREGQKWALGRVVLAVHRHLVLVRPRGRWLVMDLLHYPATVRMSAGAEANGPAEATAEEVRLMGMLMDARSDPLDWSRYRDTTGEELTALIEAKVAGQPVAPPTDDPPAAQHLLQALKQSVADAQKNRDVNRSQARPPRSARRSR